MFEYFFIIYLFDKYKLEFNMTDDDNNPIIPNWTGTSTNGGHENGEDLNTLKLEMIALKAQVQVLQTENKQLVDEKKIQEDKCRCSKLEKEMREKLLKRKLQESQDEFAEQKFRSLEEKYLNEIAELKAKNQELAGKYEEKQKELEEMIKMNEQKIGKTETETESMVSIREMAIQLPLENWHDLLAFVPRSQLGNVVSQIGDRQFAYIIQSFLHDPVREITLHYMNIIPPRINVSSDQPMVKVAHKAATNMPDWPPMPGNIKNFKGIVLNYVDASILSFLGKFKENSLLTDVNMLFQFRDQEILEDYVLQRVLIKIAPFITSIDSMSSPTVDLIDMVYNDSKMYNNESQLLLMEMMAKTRILLTHWYDYDNEFESWEDKMDWCFSWLYTPRDDGKPRMLISYDQFIEATDCASFIECIKKDFEIANNPVSFFIYASIHQDEIIEDISLENAKTEKLVIKTKSGGLLGMERKLLISRYPLNAAKSWIEENEKEISGWEWQIWKPDREIYFDNELTIAI